MFHWYVKVLKNYANFNGRARRREYWYFALMNVVIAVVLNIAAYMLPVLVILSPIYTLATLVPGIAVGVRRMHDTGKSGWFILVPVYNLVLACTAGTKGANQYGSDPKDGDSFDFDKNRFARS